MPAALGAGGAASAKAGIKAIESASEALSGLSAELAQKLYAEQAAAGGGEAQSAGAGRSSGRDDDAVDAEFEEVKDDK